VITDPQERSIVSSLGRVDGGSIRCLDVASGRHRNVAIRAAKYVSLRPGTNGDFGAVRGDPSR
jgi:hypothetical protein